MGGDVRAAASGVLDPAHLAAFVGRHWAVDVQRVRLQVQPLSGGLEAVAVARVQAEVVDEGPHGGTPASRPATGWEPPILGDRVGTRDQACPRSVTFVVKRLDGAGQREAAVYELLATSASPVPQVLGITPISPTCSYLFLEWIPPRPTWPWAEPALAGLVLERVARLHASLPLAHFAGPVASWDYEADLLASAGATLAALEAAVAGAGLADGDQLVPAVRRVVAALPVIRRQLLAASALGPAVLHGDLHSGNVLLRGEGPQHAAVLLDWGRARVGSPLEDVSSWVESLGYWEPAVRHCRDQLLRDYLAARDLPSRLAGEVRTAYWLAAACNTLAGALRYHVRLASRGADADGRRQGEALRAALDHLHIIRQADAVWGHAFLPQMLMLINAGDTAGPLRPAHAADAGASEPAPDPGAGHDPDPLVEMRSGDALDNFQDAATDDALRLATAAADVIVSLGQLGPPDGVLASLHFDPWQTAEVAAADGAP